MEIDCTNPFPFLYYRQVGTKFEAVNVISIKYVSAPNPWFHVLIFQNDKKRMSVSVVRLKPNKIQSAQSSAGPLHAAIME